MFISRYFPFFIKSCNPIEDHMMISVVSRRKNLIQSKTDLLIESQTLGRFQPLFSIFNLSQKNIAFVLWSMIKRVDQRIKIVILSRIYREIVVKVWEFELETLCYIFPSLDDHYPYVTFFQVLNIFLMLHRIKEQTLLNRLT